jgi:hypothetical protein
MPRFNALMGGFDLAKPSVSVALPDGVGEIELASVFDFYPGQVSTANVTTMGYRARTPLDDHQARLDRDTSAGP